MTFQFTYNQQKLTKFKDKTAGKNNSDVDGFYETDGEPKRHYFIKKPADQKELFIEGLIGRLFTRLKEKDSLRKSIIAHSFFSDPEPQEEVPLSVDLKMKEPLAFPDRMNIWKEHFEKLEQFIDFTQINYKLLTQDFARYVAILAHQTETT